MYKIAVDLGHGFVKGVGENGRAVIFPSLVGEGFERQVKDVFGSGREARTKEYEVIVDGKRYFVGNLAASESWNATRAFDESRLTHFSTPVLYGTAAALLMGNAPYPVHVAAGLPFELFKTQRGDLLKALGDMEAIVEVAGHVPPRHISFDAATVVPQAAGAFYSAVLDQEGVPTTEGRDILREGGMAAIVDTGYKTTDFMLVDLGTLEVVESLCGTVNMGMNDVLLAAQREIQQACGDVIDLLEVEQAFVRRKFWFKGKEYPVAGIFADCVEGLAERVADRLRATWKDRQKYMRVLFLAGGGAAALAHAFLRRQMPVRVISDPQFANARGFLSLAARKEANERKVRLA